MEPIGLNTSRQKFIEDLCDLLFQMARPRISRVEECKKNVEEKLELLELTDYWKRGKVWFTIIPQKLEGD